MYQYIFSTSKQLFFIFALSIIIFMRIVSIGSISNKSSRCPNSEETVILENESFVVKWKDPGGLFSQDVIAFPQPKFYDENGNLIFRICTSTGWLPFANQSRYKAIEKSELCPPQFIEHEDVCINFTEPRTASELCPIPGATYYIDKFNIKTFMWMPLRKYNNYTPYKVITLGSKYQKNYEKCSSKCCSNPDSLKENCLIANASCIRDVPCDGKYPYLCAYDFNHFLYKCPKGCVPAGLGKDHCWCKTLIKEVKQMRQKFCEDLAEIGSTVDLSVIQELVKSDTCWINIKSNLIDWNEMYPAINEDRIELHKDGSLSCAVCKVDPGDIPKPEMMLKFDPTKKKIYLRVFYPRSLFAAADNDEIVYCFVNQSKNYSDRVETNEVWNSEDDDDRKFSKPFSIYKVSVVTDTESFYWCEGFKLPKLERIVSNTVRAYHKTKGCRFSSRVKFKNFCFFMKNCDNIKYSDINYMLKKMYNDDSFSSIWSDLKVIGIHNIDKPNHLLEITFHVILKSCDSPHWTKSVIETALKLNPLAEIIFLRSVDYCFSENTVSGSKNLLWPLTSIGNTVLSDDVCVEENFVPVTRTCKGNFYSGAEWLPVNGICSENKLSNASLLLLNVSRSVFNNTSNLLNDVYEVITEIKNVNILDTYSVGKILYDSSIKGQIFSVKDLEKALDIINSVSDFNDDLLKESQKILNSTDIILDAAEKLIDEVNITEIEDSFVLLRKKNLIVLVSDPIVSNISGLIIRDEDSNSFEDIEVEFLYTNTTHEDLLQIDNLEVGTFISNDTISQLIVQNNLTTLKVAVVVYYKESFFQARKNKVNSRILSVSMPGLNDLLPFSVPVFFKSTNTSKNQKQCGFWNYGLDAPEGRGEWSTIGSEKSNSVNSTVDFCIFSHLTHFALLVSNYPIYANVSDATYFEIKTKSIGLEVITGLGCCLSLLGILGIYITAITFPSWRNKTGNKILLQLAHAILGIITGLYLIGTVTLDNRLMCIIVGIFLHYAVLAKFSWMLVSAILQFYRFVVVIGPMPSHILLKSMIIGWLFPLIPVIIVASINYGAYGSQMCYPRQYYLYFGVLMPILIILTVNMYVFIKVMNNVRKSNAKFSASSSNLLLRRELFLAILLLFLLGLPWFFGLMIELTSFNDFLRGLFLHLFCILASIEGFVLFCFYVLLDGATRQMWLKYIKKNAIFTAYKKQIIDTISDQSTKDSKINTNSSNNTK